MSSLLFLISTPERRGLLSGLVPLVLGSPTSSSSRTHLHRAGIWHPSPSQSSNLTSLTLTGQESDIPHSCWSLPCLPGSAGNRRVPLLSSRCPLAHSVMIQGCVSNQSLQEQALGVRDPVDFQYGTGLDLHVGMSKCAQFGSVCRNLFIVFIWPCRPSSIALEIRAEQS